MKRVAEDLIGNIEQYLSNHNEGSEINVPISFIKELVYLLEGHTNEDYERSETITYLLNGWFEEPVTLQVLCYDDKSEGFVECNFKVPRQWLDDYVTSIQDVDIKTWSSLDDFLLTYTSEDSVLVYEEALRDGVLLEDNTLEVWGCE